uniref:Uncharacterized protein n=1 Tax=Arundo donax TaxID=35708 RepID=A0A0A9B2G4_ARUDO
MFGVSGPPRSGLLDRSLHIVYISNLTYVFSVRISSSTRRL